MKAVRFQKRIMKLGNVIAHFQMYGFIGKGNHDEQ